MENFQEDSMKQLKSKISTIDFLSKVENLGGKLNDNKLILKCLGKDFEIDAEGNVTSQCHTHAWFIIPLFNYILFGNGKDICGEWVPFRELKNGA